MCINFKTVLDKLLESAILLVDAILHHTKRATAMSKATDLKHCMELASITEQYFWEYVRNCCKIADPSIGNFPEDVSYATYETVEYKREMFLSYQRILRNVSNAYYDDHGITKDNPKIERVIRLSI